MSPRVSVVLAVKDGEDYLAEAIGSVLGQTFRDFELLVVDDGSRDGTPAVLAAIDDDRLRVLRNETNLGEAPSRNRAVREARGEYVAILDHDDVALPERLAREVDVLDRESAVAVVGTWTALVVDGARVGRVAQRIRTRVDFVHHCLVGDLQIPHSSTMFRRAAMLELGGYDESLMPSEDFDLLLRFCLAGYGARVIDEELVRYRLHERQLSRVHEDRQRANAAAAHERFLRELAGDLHRLGLSVEEEKEVQALVEASRRHAARARAWHRLAGFGGVVVRPLARHPALARLRASARRRPLARRIYARLLGRDDG